MPPRRTIIVDRDAILAGIKRAVAEDVDNFSAELDAEVAAKNYLTGRLRGALRQAKDGWTKYDLPRFVGRELTPSERIRHQEAIRDMEANGLVEIFGAKAREIRLTGK